MKADAQCIHQDLLFVHWLTSTEILDNIDGCLYTSYYTCVVLLKPTFLLILRVFGSLEDSLQKEVETEVKILWQRIKVLK